jgi:hypothetical protein
MRKPVLVDGRNQFEPASMRSLGFIYSSIGRPSGAIMTDAA